MIIEITGFYDEIAWYAKMIGKTFEVLEKEEDGHVKVKRGDGRISYWVGPNDYKSVNEGSVNGWKYYRNPTHGKMVAYYESAGEQLVFDGDGAFERWLEAEKNE